MISHRVIRTMFAAALLIGFYSCAWVIPDYYMNQHIWEPLPPQMRVMMTPMGHTCADAVHTGDKGKVVTILVDFIEMDPIPFTIHLGDEHHIEFPAAPTTFEWFAGEGRHTVLIEAGERRIWRGVTVYKCVKGKLPTKRMWY